MNDSFQITHDDGIAWLRIHNPIRKGAMTRAMWDGLPEAIYTATAHDDARVLVITGTEGNFVAGADIKEFAALRNDPALANRYDEGARRTLAALDYSSIPTIAMIGGACVGGGVLIASGCDFRLAASDVRIGITAGRLGLAYPPEALERLVHIYGEPLAMRMLLTSTLFDGHEATRLGIVHESYGPEVLETETRKLCRRIARNAPIALKYARLQVRKASSRLHVDTAALVKDCFQSEDYAEGIDAFLNKRQPHFTGK